MSTQIEELEYARAAAHAAMDEAKSTTTRRAGRLKVRPVPGLFTCPVCRRLNLKARHRAVVDGVVVWEIFAHIAGHSESGHGPCEGSRGPGEPQE